jgi:RND family efflux transporter MFP subunit
MPDIYGLGLVTRWALALGVCLIALSGCKGNAQPQTPPPPEVAVVEVRPGPVTVYNEYVAQTQAPDTIEIRSQVTGLLARQTFVDGNRVKKGDVLYVIDQRPFEAQLAQAKASLAQAEANLVNAKQNLARNSRLIAQKAVSQQDYDTAVAQERSGAALVEAQRALLRNVELNLEFATLRASRDGFMSSSLVKPGALITAQQTLLTTLYSSDPMWVNFSISEDRFLELQKTLKHPPGEQPIRRRRFTSALPMAPTIRSRGSSTSSTRRSIRRAGRCRCASRYPIPVASCAPDCSCASSSLPSRIRTRSGFRSRLSRSCRD